jgi:excisionase family DNA binding protein
MDRPSVLNQIVLSNPLEFLESRSASMQNSSFLSFAKREQSIAGTLAGAQPKIAANASLWMTAAEAAHYLRVRTRTLLLWTRQSKVKGYALSGTQRHVWRFRREDLDAAFFQLAADAMLNSRLSSVRSAEKEAVR